MDRRLTDTTQKAGAELRGVDVPRRRWSEAHKRRVVAESYRSGDTVSEVAQRHGVHSSLLFRWRRRYRKAADTGTGTGFVPVVVEAPEPASARRMEIVLGAYIPHGVRPAAVSVERRTVPGGAIASKRPPGAAAIKAASRAAQSPDSNSLWKATSARRRPVSVRTTDLALLTGSEISPFS